MAWLRRFVLTLPLLVAPVLAHAGDLTTRDLVELHRAGLDDDVLVALIEVDGGPFDVSHADLLDLRAEGLSGRVLAALVRAGRTVEAAPLNEDAGAVETTPPVPHSTSASPLDHSFTTWAGGSDVHHESHVVAVPVPVYVAPPRRGRHGTGRFGPDRDDRRRHLPPDVPGVKRGRETGDPSTAGVARGTTPTVDSIRRTGPGFHPGEVGPRTPPSAREGRDRGATDTPRAASPPSRTPGVARSGGSASNASTPGVARGRRTPDN